jgi:hypothetical protein
VTRYLILVFVLTSASAQRGKVVFLRNHQIFSANEDGKEVKQITADAVPRYHPKWSPDGSRIAYELDGNSDADPKTHVVLGVMTEAGTSAARVPVFATQDDGTLRLGMRFVEESGWFSNHDLYASGSANPTTEELRQIEISPTGHEKHGFLGEWFSICPGHGSAEGKVVNLSELPHFTERTDVTFKLNGKSFYPQTGSLSIHSVFSRGLWLHGCTQVAFVQQRQTNLYLVILGLDGTERALPLPANAESASPALESDGPIANGGPNSIATIAGASDVVFLKTASGVGSIDLVSGKFTPGMTGNAAQAWTAVQKRIAAREKVAKALQAEEPDWWPRIAHEEEVRRIQ